MVDKAINNLAAFPIGIVSELLNVHPETVRVWERYGVIKPKRRSGKRFFSETDIKRLQFIQKLIADDLNLPAIRHYLQLYPCWEMDNCPVCMHSSELAVCAKQCWKKDGTYCQADANEDTCSGCEYCKEAKLNNTQQ
jgi:MerR family transcriptional regulator, heat shock protein HspR